METSSQIQEALEKLHLPYTHFEHIIHENALSALVARVWLKDKTTVILKKTYNPIRFRKEAYYLSFLQGKIPVPKLKKTLENTTILMEDIPGRVLPPSALTPKLAFDMGKMMAELHDIPIDRYGDLSLAAPNDPISPLTLMQEYLNSSLEECKGIVDSNLLKQSESYFKKHAPLLDHVDGPCITHRDYRPGNILVLNGRIQALIDFELAQASFAEEDFARIDQLVWHRYPQSRAPFYDGYTSRRPLPLLEDILPFLRFLKALGAIGFTVERKTYDSLHKHIFEDNLNSIQSLLSMKRPSAGCSATTPWHS